MELTRRLAAAPATLGSRAIRLVPVSLRWAAVGIAGLALVSTGTPRTAHAEGTPFQILSRAGELFTKVGKDEAKPLAPEAEAVPADDTIGAGAPVGAKQRAETLKAEPKSHAAVALSPREVATLVTGAALRRSAKDAAHPEYRLTGPVHLLIHGPKQDGKAADALLITINGVPIETSEAHLFFDGWKTPARLTVVSGELTLPAPKFAEATKSAGAGPAASEKAAPPAAVAPATAPATPPASGATPAADAKPEGKAAAPPAPPAAAPAGPIQVTAGQVVILDPAGAKVAPKDKSAGQTLKWSTLAGFEAPGTYKRAGVAVSPDESATVMRNGVEATLTGKRIPLFEGDEVLVPAGKKTELLLDSKDKIGLTGEARFKIETFGAKGVLPQFVFSIFGKVRALIAPKDPGSIRLRTPTATIGVKGTDFETLASEANTDVSVLEGKVGVGDASGAGEVDVPAGFSTSVAKGAKPTAPKPLPPEKLKELRAEGPGPAALNIASPTEGQVLAQGKIEFTVDPPSASIEVLLDEKPLAIASGGALPADLADGPHKVTVKGTAAGTLSKSVSFTVDRKPPALDPAIALTALTLVEGTPLVLKWTKPLASAEATYDGKAVPLVLSADDLTAPLALDPAVLKDTATPIKLKATDKAGNTVTLEGMLTYKRKPAKAIVLTPSQPGPVWITNDPTDLKVGADRDVEKWDVLLDGQPATERFLPKPDAAQPPKVPKDIVLGAAALLALPDGDHPIVVKATDSFGTPSEIKVTLRLDRKPPTLTAKNAKDGAAMALPAPGAPAPVLKPGRYEFAAGKPLASLHVKIDGKEQAVALSETKDHFELVAEEPALKPGEHPVEVQLVDPAGNSVTVALKVRVEAPVAAKPQAEPVPVAAPAAGVAEVAPDREAVLRRSYERTAAGETGTLLDQMYLGERSAFVFIPTTTTAGGAVQAGGALYRQGKMNSVGKNLAEPFVREILQQP